MGDKTAARSKAPAARRINRIETIIKTPEGKKAAGSFYVPAAPSTMTASVDSLVRAAISRGRF
jgi:hypothetical protein